MQEYNYLVYEPTPMGEGIAIALFSTMELATVFMEAYLCKYYHETKLAIMKVKVDGNTNLHSFMNREAFPDDES